MKHANTLKATAGFLAMAPLILPAAAQAAGVGAGTLIENTASASYDNGGTPVTIQSNKVTIKVDELLDVAVAPLDSGAVAAGAGVAVLSYRVTNTGNGSEAFSITVNPAVAGNGFDAAVQAIAVDANGNGSYDAGVDTVIANGGATAAIAADGNARVFVLVTLPAGTADAATSQLRLTAQALTGSGTPGTVFAGQGAGGGDAVVGLSTASGNALGALVASASTLALTKSYAILDPFGGSKPVPGATITFTIQAAATGSAELANLHVTDAIPAGTTYVANSITLQGTALTDAADGDAGVAGAAGVDVTIGSLAGGASRTVTFKTTID